RHRTAPEPVSTVPPARSRPFRPPAPDARATARQKWKRRASARRFSSIMRSAEIQHAGQDFVGIRGDRLAIAGRHGRKRPAVVDRRPEPRQRLTVLGHAVALVALEPVAWMRE